jgi:uncharacterized protein YjeT (DUF2065 family)
MEPYMDSIVFLLGLIYISTSACFILYTRESVHFIKRQTTIFQLKYLAFIPAIFGFLFLISATAIIYPWVFRVIGILSVAEAVIIFSDPKGIYTRFLAWYFGLSDQVQRLFGIIGIVFGTVIMTWVK